MDRLPTQIWDWVFLAQHHHVPTRLLDWTENALVGLYFAAQDYFDIPSDAHSARDGVVWIIDPVVMNQTLGQSQSNNDLPMFDISPELAPYSPLEQPNTKLPPKAALAARSFPRISAQWGTFTVCNFPTAIDKLPTQSQFLRTIIVPAAHKFRIRQQLAVIKLDGRTLFQDLFRLGERLTEQYT